MEFGGDFLSDAANLFALGAVAGGGLTALLVAGYLPRVGIGRALTLQFKSKFSRVSPLSVRKSEMNTLLAYLHISSKGKYVCVTGGKGQGKSCLIDTALCGHGGVVKFSTQSGADKDEIVDQALMEITGLPSNQFDLSANARRVLFFHNLFFSPPIVVLHVPERIKNAPYADTPSAVRSLADEYGLKVVVDGAPNSLPEELFRTGRQQIFDIEPMKREVLEDIPEFNDLMKFLYNHQLADGVWKVLGGSPVHYVNLMEVYLLYRKTDENKIVEAIKNSITSVLRAAQDSITDSSANMKRIVQYFRVNGVLQFPKDLLASQNMILDSPNEIFKEVHLGGKFLVPATPAIAIMIEENLSPDQDPALVTKRLFAEKSGN